MNSKKNPWVRFSLKCKKKVFSFIHIQITLDINECAGTNDCDENAFCTNTEGSYTCSCKSGYAGNGQSCTGIFRLFYFPYIPLTLLWFRGGVNLPQGQKKGYYQ